MARLFTLAEANALLPRLRRDFATIAQIRADAHAIRDEISQLELKGKSNGKDLATKIRERQERLEGYRAQINSVLEGIIELGVEVKDVEQGLVDFPAERDGRTVYLCWKLDEESIRFWHELSTGFAGRIPL